MKLTMALKEKIAGDAARDLFAEPLLKQFSDVQAKIENLVRDSYSDFDFKNVEPYQEYINWHEHIKIPDIPGDWGISRDAFRRACGLPIIEYFDLPFKIPSDGAYTPYLAETHHKKAVEIIRPYMINYFAARKAYDEIKRVLLGVNTSKQLEESLPELAKYLPNAADGAVTALVPIEQINRVRSLFKGKQEVA